MKTHKGNLYLWIEGDSEKREIPIELRSDERPESTALEVCADRNGEIMEEVLKHVKWAFVLHNRFYS
jgi:hypothetical protein